MRRATIPPMSKRLIDPGLLLTLLLCLFTMWPLLQKPGLPNGTDTLYHIYRAAEMDRAWTHGLLIPSWAETFYYGYGSPVFHFYASFTYYVTSALMRLFTLNAVESLRLLTAMCMLLAGGGMYLFMRDAVSKLAGILAALAYVYSPYILFTEPYTRGAYPELLALALFPLVMWRYERLLRNGGGINLVLAALSSGLLIITHNLMALVLTGMLGGWLVWRRIFPALTPNPSASASWRGAFRAIFLPFTLRRFLGSRFLEPTSRKVLAFTPRPEGEGPGVRAINTPLSRNPLRAKGPGDEGQQTGNANHLLLSLLALILGIGLAAYFWLPVIAEQDAARLGNLTAVAQLDFRHFFVPLGELLAYSPRNDVGAINGLAVHQLNLGVAQWVLASVGIIGVVIVYRTSISQRLTLPLQFVERGLGGEVAFFALACAALIFLMLPLSSFLWEAAAPLAFLQFPWRFLGPAAFGLAALAGLNAIWLERLPARIGGSITVLLIVLPMAMAMPTLVVDEWDNTAVDTSVAAYHNAEVSGLQRATTFSDEYLPATVITEPSANADLLADYADGYPVDKANRAALPEGVTLTLLDHGPQHDSWQVEADDAFTLEVLTYYFPGWQAEIDGEAVPVRTSEPHGFITFDVPAGTHTIRLFMGPTPARSTGVAVTVSAAVALVAIAMYVWRRGGSLVPFRVGTAQSMQSVYYRAVIAGGLIQLVLMIVFMREGGAWVNSPPGTAVVAQNQTVFDLGESIQLVGYDLNSRTFRPGERLALTVYWYARSPVEHGYASFVHITNGGPPLAQADAQNPAGRPTLKWTSDGYIRDPYIIDLPATMPPGEYQLTIGLYTCETLPSGECGNGDRLNVTDVNGTVLGDAVPLGTITIQ
jgi:hypothetical protein